MSMTTNEGGVNSVSSSTPINVYLYAGDMIIENVTAGYFYFQDSLGNTSHVTDAVGNLLERYNYSAFGMPYFYNAVGTQLAGSAYGIRHLFQGQLWTQETGLNDYRNRVEIPMMGVFLQPDPIGFEGDPVNIYRFCGNDPVNVSDPSGLTFIYATGYDDNNGSTTERVIVTGTSIDDPSREAGLFDLWSDASLRDYYKNSIHDEFGLRESSSDSQFTSGSLSANSPSTQNSDPLSALLRTIGNMTYTVSFEHHLHTFWIRAGRVPIPVPFGVHAFATVDKKGYTIGIGPGIVGGSSLAAMTGRPFGESSGVQLVSQAVYARGNWGIYAAGVPWSSSGGSSYEIGGAYGLGAGVSITLEGTYRHDWPWRK